MEDLANALEQSQSLKKDLDLRRHESPGRNSLLLSLTINVQVTGEHATCQRFSLSAE